MKRPLSEIIYGFIVHNNLILPGEKVVVGVSGGADSVCLIHVLSALRESLGISLHVAHLNHMLRGTESEEDARYVAELADQLKLPATIEARDVRAYREAHRLSMEDAARQVRYGFFADVAAQLGAVRLAVGHTADDQAETILMHLVRGTGSSGLLGMRSLTVWTSPALSGLIVIRPLLGITREETHVYCREHSLRPREDSSNSSPSLFRNRIRRELMPLLRSCNPKVREALIRTSDTLAAELSFLEEYASGLWPQVAVEEGAAVLLDRRSILALHPSIQRRLLRMATRKVLGDLEDFEWKHIEKMRAGLNLRKGKRVNLPRRLTLSVEGHKIRVSAT